MILKINLRRLPSQHGDFSVMLCWRHMQRTSFNHQFDKCHYPNRPLKNTALLKGVKVDNFGTNNFEFSLTFAQNKDCG